MRQIDQRYLGDDELVFCLETNRGIDATRFLAFINGLLDVDSNGLLPDYAMDILELSTGSFFGRLKVTWSTEEIDEGRLAKLEDQVSKLIAKSDAQDAVGHELAERATIAAERAANAAESQLEIARSGNRTQNVLAAIGMAGLLLSCAQNVKSEVSSPCGEAVKSIIQEDGVSAVYLWCKTKHVVLRRGDVGLIVREEREQRFAEDTSGDILRATGTVSVGTLTSAGTSFIDVHSASSDHTVSSPARGPASRTLLPNEIARMRGERVERTGTINIGEELMALAPIDGANGGRTIIVIPPTSFAVHEATVATVRGRLFRLEGPHDLMVADTIIPVSPRST